MQSFRPLASGAQAMPIYATVMKQRISAELLPLCARHAKDGFASWVIVAQCSLTASGDSAAL
jgi:hypothetical protein